MKSTIKTIALIVLAIAAVFASPWSFGQAAASSTRTVKTKVVPVYPELAKRMNIGGTVRVELTVDKAGQVKAAKAIGGPPLLIDAAVSAAKQFKFVAAADESVEVIPFNFNHGQ
jgi:TonB family protein